MIIKTNDNNTEQIFKEAVKLYEQGKLSESVALLKKASSLGHVYASTNLGICYYYGDGVEQNISKAKTLFETSAKNNDSSALYYLGIIAKNGIECKPNAERALSLLTKAAEAGNPDAQYALGELYVTGVSIGIQQDLRRAVHWFAYAAQQGHTLAQSKFHALYYSGYETKQAPTGFWFERESVEHKEIPCSVPFSVTITNSEYVVPELKVVKK